MTKAKKILILSGSLIVIILMIIFFVRARQVLDPLKFEFVEVSQGDLVAVVSATGTINPLNTFTVGTQVSGIIEKIYVDFNDEVSQGQVLAELDQSVLKVNVANSETNLKKAQAGQRLAQIEYERTQALKAKEYVPQSDLDIKQVEAELKQAEVETAQIELERDQVELNYAVITSPVSGVILSREVEVGQTVAADFTTPELFFIAEQLDAMKIEADISEADISKIKSGQKVIFNVDAYPQQEFIGHVAQVRLDPNNDNNVITYSVIITVDNSQLLLFPGMTAFVNIEVAQKNNALYVDNAAFRFIPQQPFVLPEDEAQTPIYLWRDTGLQPVAVDKGLQTMLFTEIISSEIQAGDQVVIYYLG
ncbi:MAG: efflux RND transporter periplasmic adaptor subunit [Gammaproteobacteria bacterium]